MKTPELKPKRNGRVRSSELLAGIPERVCPQCGGSGTVCDPAQIGLRMKTAREAAGISGREMARRMGYSAMYVCDLEHGRRDWKAKLIESYVRALPANDQAQRPARTTGDS
jgi:predicted transcriptional regulator